MQAIILAAGMGKRLKNKTANHTKCMVPILGKTFLQHSLDKLTAFDISRIILVIGYCGAEIQEAVGDFYNGIPVVYVENPVYETTNNIYSLYLARDYFVQEDTLLLESDLIYEQDIIKRLLDNPHPNLAVVDKYRPHMDGTVVKINERDEILAFISKKDFDYSESDVYYKTVNIYKFSKTFLKERYLPFLEAYCKATGYDSYYEQVLKVILGLEKHDLKVLRLNKDKWFEVDDLQDYDIAQCMFCTDPVGKADNYNERYGGYWRFEALKDFCYLVNPYFPPPRMVAELKNNFYSLLSGYPSGQSVQRLLISNVFDLDQDMVLAGNGAAELLNALLPDMTGRIGLVLPTFQEYPERLRSADVRFFQPQNADFSYDADDLRVFADEIDTLILINPDNPSGNFIDRDNLLTLIDFYKKRDKKIILDESFVDFSDELDDNSLLSADILRDLTNLTVIKSISKSYGVPGLRLGIIAAADRAVLQKCHQNLPVWNINSYAEYFLQILNKYKGAYREACQAIAASRAQFSAQLARISFLRPIKSQANYILCEVKPPYRSDKLCQDLLRQEILLKDCQNKKGFGGKQYVRIAVKSKEDNDILISALSKL